MNDELVREQRLRDGDQVRIGRSILKFMTGENVEVHYHEEIYRLMTVDGLTQIFNRRYFNEALEREFNRSKRYDRAPLAHRLRHRPLQARQRHARAPRGRQPAPAASPRP